MNATFICLLQKMYSSSRGAIKMTLPAMARSQRTMKSSA